MNATCYLLYTRKLLSLNWELSVGRWSQSFHQKADSSISLLAIRYSPDGTEECECKITFCPFLSGNWLFKIYVCQINKPFSLFFFFFPSSIPLLFSSMSFFFFLKASSLAGLGLNIILHWWLMTYLSLPSITAKQSKSKYFSSFLKIWIYLTYNIVTFKVYNILLWYIYIL